MTHQYESEILNKLMERDGFNIPSSVPPYEAEIKAYLINQVKLAYPKLTDYEAEWLLYNYTKHLPADFPISSVSNVTEASFENVVPFAYQSAILKGNTLVNYFKPLDDVNASGSICGFQDGKIAFQFGDESSIWGNSYTAGNISLTNSIKVSPITKYFVKLILSKPIDGEVKFGNFKASEYSTSDIITLANNNTIIYQATVTTGTDTDYIGVILNHSVGEIVYGELLVIPYQDGMENWNISYFEGMKSVQMPVLTTTGKNLFDMNAIVKDDFELGKYHGSYYGKEFVLQPNTTYTIKPYLREEITSTSVWTVFNIITKDSVLEVINVDKTGRTGKNVMKTMTFTTDSTGKVGYSIYANLKSEEAWLGNLPFNIQLEEGSTATSYEPYKSNILTVNEDVELRGIGRGTKRVEDELDCLTGEVTERIGEIVLDGSEFWNEWRESDNSYGFALRNCKIDFKPLSIPLCNRLVGTDYSYMYDRITNKGIALYTGNSTTGFSIFIRLPKTECTGLEDFKTKLRTNPLTVQYELASPTIKTVDLKTVNESGESVHFMPIEGTMNVQSSGEIIQPTFDMAVPVEATTQNLASFIDLEMEE